jgi:8-oxo-dGTP pyrophosphatase MutT (NUDIX family)
MRLVDAARRLADLPQGPPPAGALPPAPDAIRAVVVGAATDEERLRRDAGRLLRDVTAEPRAAAALVLLFPGDDGEARLVLMERTDDGGAHGGQVSCPGGSLEPDDRDAVEAALREAAEEVGLDADAAGVTVLGRLERIHVAASGFTIDPVVAVAARRPVLAPNPVEVAAILTPPLAAFLPGAPIVEVEDVVRGWPLRFGGYAVEGRIVWGATARILGQLGAIIGPD